MTDIDLPPGVVHDGAGVVARWPGVVVVIPHDPSHTEAVAEMFAELGTNPDPADVVRAIRELTIDQVTLTAAAYLMSATGGPLAFAHGSTEILVDDQVTLSGDGGPNEIHINAGNRFTVRSNGDGANDPLAPSDLRRGVTPGGGITLGEVRVRTTDLSPPPLDATPRPPAQITGGDDDPATSVSPRAIPVPDAQPEKIEVPFRSELLVGAGVPTLAPRPALAIAQRPAPTGDEVTAPEPKGGDRRVVAGATEVVAPQPEPEREPLPAEPSTPAEDEGVVVQGIRCIKEHFNNPNAAFCMICGISMVQQTHTLVAGPRPPLGFVVFDDGSTFGLDRSYVVGREPGQTGDRHTAPLTIQDNNETLSRRHAEIRLIEWIVHIVDLGSTNGTFIWDSVNNRWNQIPVNQPIPLASGATVALGRRTFVFESATR